MQAPLKIAIQYFGILILLLYSLTVVEKIKISKIGISPNIFR